MKNKVLTSALFNSRNFIVLLLALSAVYFGIDIAAGNNIIDLKSYPLGELAAYSSGIGVYLAFVAQSLFSKNFHEQFNRKEKIKQIKRLNAMSGRLASEAKRNTNSTYLQRMKKVMSEKEDIVNSFFHGEHSYLKERIVEQTLNLVVAYLKLLNNFCIRSRGLSNVDVGTITERINVNIRKLNFTKDAHASEDIKKVIEMDEKLIIRMKEEKQNLERMSAKLDYMESTINMFKHQIVSSVESEEMLEKLDTAVKEASALDSVLDERSKNRLRM